MSKIVAAGFMVVLVSGAAAQEGYQPPKPVKEHEWLKQLVGEWDNEGEVTTGPGQPPLKTKGSESGRMVGGFWAVLENKGDFMGTPFTGILTLGYDPEKKKYIGTWFDSVSSYLWRYEGSVDATGKILTLDTEGPDHGQPGKLAKFREVVEVKDADHKVFTSSMEKDGKWITFVRMSYTRKKK